MARANLFHRLKENILFWIALSIVAHLGLLILAHPFASAAPTLKPAIVVQLVTPPPKPPEAEPEPEPEPPQPEPVKPPPRKLEPKPVQAKTEEPPPREDPPPNVVAVAPTPEEQAPPPEVIKVPPPEPKPEPPKPEPSDADIKAYGRAFGNEIDGCKSYPRIAQMRGWEGSNSVRVNYDSNGRITSMNIEKPSDRDVFNTEAKKMAECAAAKMPPPSGSLHGSGFSITVPINFRLDR
ncbi:MAG: energy transducer TonB [Methylobacillus sp.]|jgi:protein TonB|nr:energy transducer TonB [Methylobacillus sp.]